MKETSLEAYHSTRDMAETHKRIIIDTMNDIGSPLTSEQIAYYSRIDYIRIARRMSELEKDGKVVCTELKGRTSSGRMANKWALV